MSVPAARGGARRARRPRGVRESLLSIVLGLEAAVMFFATLTVNGLTDLDPWAVLAGGGLFMLVLVVVAALQRYGWGVVLGGILQGAIIATGFLTPFMFVVGGGFAVFWVWCLLRARRIESQQAAAIGGETA